MARGEEGATQLDSARGFFKECREELNKVVKPTRQETIQATLVTLFIVVFVAALLAIFDLIFGQVMGQLLSTGR